MSTQIVPESNRTHGLLARFWSTFKYHDYNHFMHASLMLIILSATLSAQNGALGESAIKRGFSWPAKICCQHCSPPTFRARFKMW